MAQASASSVPVNFIQLYPVLAKEGLTLEAIEVALAEPKHRHRILAVWLDGPNEIEIPAELDREACIRLISWTHDLYPDRIYPDFDSEEEIKQKEEANQVKRAEAERLATDEYVRELLALVTPRQRSVIILSFGLDGRGRRKQKEIGEQFHRSGTSIGNQLSGGMSNIRAEALRRKHEEMIAAHLSSADDGILGLSIELLNLGERAVACLRRAQIRTVGELTNKTEDDLLCITNFGMKSLDDVKERLAAYDLGLTPA